MDFCIISFSLSWYASGFSGIFQRIHLISFEISFSLKSLMRTFHIKSPPVRVEIVNCTLAAAFFHRVLSHNCYNPQLHATSSERER